LMIALGFSGKRCERITRGSPAPLAALASQNPALTVTAPAVVPELSTEVEGGRRRAGRRVRHPRNR